MAKLKRGKQMLFVFVVIRAPTHASDSISVALESLFSLSSQSIPDDQGIIIRPRNNFGSLTLFGIQWLDLAE